MISLIAVLVLAQDFEGTWKVPEAQSLNGGKCKAGDAKECLRIAWSAEAGIRSAGETDLQRLEEAARFHQLACDAAKRPACENAERLKKKLEAAKTADDKFWCDDALENTTRFEVSTGSARAVVMGACKKLFPARFQKALDAVSNVPPQMKMMMLVQAALEDLCPGLKSKPKACSSKSAEKISEGQLKAAFSSIVEAQLGSANAKVVADALAK